MKAQDYVQIVGVLLVLFFPVAMLMLIWFDVELWSKIILSDIVLIAVVWFVDKLYDYRKDSEL